MSALEGIHWLDATIVVVLVVGALLGACTGVLRQLARLLTYLTAVYATTHLHESVAEALSMQFQEPGFLKSAAGLGLSAPRVASFGATLFVVYLGLFIVTLLFQKVVKMLFLAEDGTAVKALGLQTLDRLGGAAVGCALAALLGCTAVLGLALYPDQRVQTSLAGSQLRPAFLKGARVALAAIPRDYKDELDQALRHLEQAGRDFVEDVGARRQREAADALRDAAEQGRRQASGQPASPREKSGQSAGPSR